MAKKIILIVDDEPKNIKLARSVLQVSGYTTIEAADGKQAVELARAIKPDLILMDIRMPVMDGLKAIRILKTDASTKNIPIIALTSSVMRGDKERILQAGCDGYLAKPFDIQELREKVAEYLPA